MSRRVDEMQVLAIPEPEGTDTWKPVSHARVIHALEDACFSQGIEVVSREYSLNQSGTRMFGSWQLDISNGNREISYAMGIRNAVDKTLALGICAGSYVYVCSNMAFKGDFISFSKHTKSLTEEKLELLAYQALEGAKPQMKRLVEWQRSLKELYVTPMELRIFVYEAMQAGVLPPSQFQSFHSCLDEEMALTHGYRTAWAVYGAITRLNRKGSLFTVAQRTGGLNNLMSWYLRDGRESGRELPADMIIDV